MNKSYQRGFTLLEILVVMAILSMLVAAVSTNVLTFGDEAKVTSAKKDLETLSSALDLYRLDNHHYPSTDQGLAALSEKPSGTPEAINWRSGGYLKKKAKDPWGYQYVYIKTEDHFELYSLGADGQEGGEGFNSDLHVKDL